jgi:predicted  nucleic acid-binding Zn-ribbon protein
MSQIKELTTAEEKLRNLYNLQRIDSKIDEIRILQGELPIEVKDLEDELEGLNVRINRLEQEVGDLTTFVTHSKTAIADAEDLIKKYTQQINKGVKNNREYDALTKEVEMQKLEMQLSNKKINDAKRDIEGKETYLNESKEILERRKKDLELKKDDLKRINTETEKEEQELIEKSKKAAEKIEPRLLTAYKRIRTTYRNGLAVVTFERRSCGGCFGKIPPQRQLEIRQRKKVILCEHCGRLLVDPNIDGPITEGL